MGRGDRSRARSIAVFSAGSAPSLLPIALAVHALRVFGRSSGGRDRSWLIFLLGMVIVLPFGVALAMGATRDDNVVSGVIGGITGLLHDCSSRDRSAPGCFSCSR